ncbi:SWIM zinc finger protein [Purpureocillium lilacinum]|uniref:SWIM zinc finger protein n=2 Tax=Purpureocillium lilacinum TaxID=33203 RepID=A0A179H215_PURLI|nr:SWIM zinc finger protein [Purpureocillium lilacinum]
MAEAHSVSIYFARGAFEADTQTAANSAMLTPAPPLQAIPYKSWHPPLASLLVSAFFGKNPMSPPISKLSSLSLEEMPPTTRAQTRMASQAAPSNYLSESLSSSDEESDNDYSEDDDEYEEPSAFAKSPTNLIYNLDQLSEQSRHFVRDVFKGYAEEMGDPFQAIADCHLDVLADALHCQVVDPDVGDELDAHRTIESRELLSSVYDVEPEDFRPDIFTSPRPGRKVVKRHDLDCTVFRMLLDDHHFFQYFLSLSRSTDPINDPFRKVSQRVDRILQTLDAFYAANSTPWPDESPTDVAWAARHIVGSIKLINSAIYTRDRPLEPHEALSAARTLVHILEAVVARNHDVRQGESRRARNLYLCLLGDRDTGFVLDQLNLLPEAASQFLHRLDALHDQIGVYGAPATYVEKFRTLLSRLRTSTAGAGLKRGTEGSQGTQRGSKRMK